MGAGSWFVCLLLSLPLAAQTAQPVVELPTGAALSLGETVEYLDSLPNPFGGAPFPSKGRFLLQEVRAERDEAVIAWGQELDKEKGSALVLGIVRRMVPQIDEVPPGEWPTLDVRDQATYTMDTKTGWPRSVEWSRTIAAPGRVRIDRHSIKKL
ncbi:MAG: hypothetical protein ACRD2T_00930 [Thermoanaerobaculia bacterium]